MSQFYLRELDKFKRPPTGDHQSANVTDYVLSIIVALVNPLIAILTIANIKRTDYYKCASCGKGIPFITGARCNRAKGLLTGFYMCEDCYDEFVPYYCNLRAKQSRYKKRRKRYIPPRTW